MHSYITIKKSKGPHKYSKFDDKYKNFTITNKKSKKAEITPKAKIQGMTLLADNRLAVCKEKEIMIYSDKSFK